MSTKIILGQQQIELVKEKNSSVQQYKLEGRSAVRKYSEEINNGANKAIFSQNMNTNTNYLGSSPSPLLSINNSPNIPSNLTQNNNFQSNFQPMSQHISSTGIQGQYMSSSSNYQSNSSNNTGALVKNAIKNFQEANEKIEVRPGEKESRNYLMEKSPTTLGQQIYETLMAQQLQFQSQGSQQQQQSQFQYQQQQQQLLQQQQQDIQQQPSLQQKFYSQNITYNNNSQINYSSLNSQINSSSNQSNQQTNPNSQTKIQITDQQSTTINSARLSVKNYIQSANNAQMLTNQSSNINNPSSHNGGRNHTLERVDSTRSGNLNNKVQNTFQYNKANNGLNSSSGAVSQSSSNMPSNNLFRKSLEYSLINQLAGISQTNSSNHVQSATINLFSSPQLNPSNNPATISQVNLSRSSNLKPAANSSQNEQASTSTAVSESKYFEAYSKTKSPREPQAATSIQKTQNKDKLSNITDYEALNQQNQLQQQAQLQQRMSTSQHHYQSNQPSFNAIKQDSQQNIQGMVVNGIDIGSRSLERKIQPIQSKLSSTSSISSKYMLSNPQKISITQYQQANQQGDSLTLAQKYSNNINTQSRQAHHSSSIINATKGKSSRSNTPSKSGTSSNYMSPSPSFLGQATLLNSQQQQHQQQQNNSSSTKLSNKFLQEYNSINQTQQQGAKNIENQNASKQQQQQQQIQKQNSLNTQNNNSSLVGQIISINSNANELNSKYSPRSSTNLQSQIQKISSTISPINSFNSNQISNLSTSPKIYQTTQQMGKEKNDNYSSNNYQSNEEKPKSQTHINVSTTPPKLSDINIETKQLAGRVIQDPFNNFLENQNARIASNMQNIQEERRSTSINKAPALTTFSINQAHPSYQNNNINNFSMQQNNSLFISSDLEANNQQNQNINYQNKPKSPSANNAKSSKPFDFSQYNSQNSQNKSYQTQQASTTISSKLSYKPLTLNTEEANQSQNQTNLPSTKSKQYHSKLLEQANQVHTAVNTNQKTQNNEDQLFNQQQIHQQYYAPSSTSYHSRVSLAGVPGSQINSSPHSQNQQNKSIDKINPKKQSNSTLKLLSDKKSNQTLQSSKSPKSTNNNSFQQNLPHQASAASSATNDNSMTHSSIKRFETSEQQSSSTHNINFSPFTKKNAEEHSTPTHPNKTENINKSYNNSQLLEFPLYSTFSSNLTKSPSSMQQTVQMLEMTKIKDKMKKILDTHTKKEKVLQNENSDLKSQILQLKQQITNQQNEITSLKSQISTQQQNNSIQYFNSSSNANQFQMSFQNLFINSQDYSSHKGQQSSPQQQQAENNQIFQSPLEISFQQHQ
ncbi:hypothetical protein TTHERM_00666970 (macronuclear) [Tetrahymena thermophila SB210]|uniref:Uncharacterized protein n=1 Tax=Tetrahymena thermophila (strain SB210) TaxID=312017 RepID=Q23T86_TETTS|nr:hypothetical protein TTHERM_00666970 [Tetrahymena thermophila SB210]EAR99820.1 hypothetical protein TTHERM_00666970 [Tetrahymena thermophila SB210]|eukprot:XP_001020065.1 hypothetical protein TTHERM_00666970 [Tetrahymena thermophila SB210]